MAITCPWCYVENDDDADRCEECGEDLPRGRPVEQQLRRRIQKKQKQQKAEEPEETYCYRCHRHYKGDRITHLARDCPGYAHAEAESRDEDPLTRSRTKRKKGTRHDDEP